MTRIAYQAASTCECELPVRRLIACQMMARLARTRIAPSASAERCSALPCPYWCPVSAGRAATPTAKKVRSAAIRSVPEWAASDSKPRLCVARPVPSLSAMSATAATTERSAVRRCGVTRELYSGDLLEGPDHDVLPAGEVAERISGQMERGNRGELDLGLCRLQVPELVMDLRAMELAAIGRVEAVALGQEPLERAGYCADHGTARPVAAAEHPAGLFQSRALVVDPVGSVGGRHTRVEVRQLVGATRSFDRKARACVEAEEPDAGFLAAAGVHVCANVQLEERRDPRYRQQPPCPKAREAEGGNADPGGAVVRLDLQPGRHMLANRLDRDTPVREEELLPGLPHRPAAPRQRPRAVLEVLERTVLARRGVELEHQIALPRSISQKLAARAPGLQISAQGLLALDRLEERLEVAVAEARRAMPLDHLEEHGRSILRGLRE